MKKKESALCPDCGNQMFFSPDGRERRCDRCGHGSQWKAVDGKASPSLKRR